jgi:uncharacterized phage protein gp47/JayE
MANEIPVSVDYTSRDYYAIREELIERVKTRIPEWSGNDSADFGVALIEAFAYMGDIANYYIDRIANEAFIATATQRDSILAIAETYGYAPSGYKNSLVQVTFYNNSNAPITLPVGTRVSGEVLVNDAVIEVTFTTITQAVVPAFANSTRGEVTVLAEEGISNTVEANSPYGVLLGTSDGSADQTFDVDDFPVVSDSIEVYVESGNTYKKWTKVQHLLDFGPNDAVYTTRFDKDNNVFILFGDGISGAIPTFQAAIRCAYTIGGGSVGNITTNVINNLDYIPGLSESQVTAIAGVIDVDNLTTAIGGAEAESNDSIRNNAPLYLRAQNRAITLDDFENLATSVTNVGKANAVGSSYTSVTLYIAPRRDNEDGDPKPGLNDDDTVTVEWTSIRDAVRDYLADKMLAGVTLTITKPTYVPVTMNIQYKLNPQYTTVVAEKALKQALVDNFGYNYVPFGAFISAQDIEYVLANVPSITRPKVQFLFKTGASPSLNSIQGLDNEILSFSEADIILEAI